MPATKLPKTMGSKDHRGVMLGEDKVMYRRQLNIRVEEKLYRRVKILAARLGVSLSSLTISMLLFALDRFETAEDAQEQS